jgi:serine/threonine protein kinase
MRREPAGRLLLRRLVRDATAAVAACHRLNLTHRDLKPPNLIVDLRRSPAVRIADFGSAVDDVTLEPLHGLYPRGPSVAEETAGYQPPESALGGAAFDPDDASTCAHFERVPPARASCGCPC